MKLSTIGLLIGGVVALGGGAFAWHVHQAQADAAMALPPNTSLAVVKRGDLIDSVSCTGSVASKLDIAIKCRASGEIIKMPYDVSDHVKKGDLLLELDPIDEQRSEDLAQVYYDQSQAKLLQTQQVELEAEKDLVTAREQADANIVAAQIKADNLSKKADRQKALLTQKLASEEDYETAQTDAATAQNDLTTAKITKQQLDSQAVALQVKKLDVQVADKQVKADQVSLDIAKQNLSYTKLFAPQDGVITSVGLNVGVGTIISSAISNVAGGTTVLTLSDLSQIFVAASVDESDYGGIALGQEVTLTADSYPGQTFTGKVVRVGNLGTNVSNVVTYDIKIEVTSPNRGLLMPMMTTNNEIIKASANHALIVPAQAIARNKGGNYVTVRHDDGTLEKREVKLGLSDSFNDEVLSGLTEGEQVLVNKIDSTSRWVKSGGKAPSAKVKSR